MTIEKLEEIIVQLNRRVATERAQLSELKEFEARIHEDYDNEASRSPFHKQLTRLQQQVFDLQDEVLEIECEIKVMKELTRANNDKIKQLQLLKSRPGLLSTAKSNSSRSLKSNDSPPIFVC
jgi:Tfp pilus assembly protein PilP